MKNVLLTSLLLLLSYLVYSQNPFDVALKEVSTDIANKLTAKNKSKIVVLYVTDINKKQTTAGKYIADVISVNIVNDKGNFQVFDRENLSGIAEANKLISEGYIDAENVKELGHILAVEVIIIGNYTVLTTTLKLTLKALDVNNGLVIAATMNDLPLNNDAGAILGINVDGKTNSNRGFNTPINSGENYNNPETVNKDCETKDLGDYCFTNNTNLKIEVHIKQGNYAFGHGEYNMTLEPGQTQCFYNIHSGAYSYNIYEFGKKMRPYSPSGAKLPPYFSREGQINVEKCSSKTNVIK